MKNQTEITLRLPEDLLRKLIYVSAAEGRSPNNHLLMLLRNSIQYFAMLTQLAEHFDIHQYDKNEAVCYTPRQIAQYIERHL